MQNKFKIDNLSIDIYEDKYQLGQAAANMAEEYISEAINTRGQAVIILATGASQFEFLASLIAKQIEWNKIISFHLDEYIGLSSNHPASFRRYLRERIIDKVGIGTFYPINGDVKHIEEQCERLNKLLGQYTIDVAFVGIGENGHLAFNDPPTCFEDEVKFKIVELDEVCRMQQMGEGWFNTVDEVPKQAITMTIPAIVEAKAIICTVPDARKAEAVKKTLAFNISPDYPASIIRRHPKATLFLENDSASLLNEFISKKQ